MNKAVGTNHASNHVQEKYKRDCYTHHLSECGLVIFGGYIPAGGIQM